MTFNLLTTPWLEVRRSSGTRALVRPCDITDRFDDDPIIALDFPRPDWNAALTEFLIGLMFIGLAPRNEDDWAELFEAPPTAQTLEAKLTPFISAFDFDGNGPRAYQDFDDLAAQEPKPLSGLLIDAPGDNALRNNSDLFIKRDGVNTLCLAYAVAALITLQTYALSGGKGHRTSMRGGGPLTTLLAPVRNGSKVATLWDKVWANVPNLKVRTSQIKVVAIFPWLSATQTSVNDEIVKIEDGNFALAFFACPRRIRLEFSDKAQCDLSGKNGAAVTGYRTQNYGANYLHWRHPLSPYYNDKKSGDMPLHPNSGPSDYGVWLAWWGFNGQAAQSVTLWKARREIVKSHLDSADSIEAFGFDMDNMKARQWLNARFPWIPVHEKARTALMEAIEQLITASDTAAKAVGKYVKIAIYGQRQGMDGHYMLPDNLSMDALREPPERLWRESEPDFKYLLDKVLERLQDGSAPTTDLKEFWLSKLRGHAMRIFDDTVDMDGLTTADPRKLLWARDKLSFEFADHPKASVRKALGLSATVKPSKSPKKKDAA
jgi:CRISPR system Cascade subunit CasA